MKFGLASIFCASFLACSSTVGWATPVTVTPGTYLFNFTYDATPPPNAELAAVVLAFGFSGVDSGDLGGWKVFDDLNGAGTVDDYSSSGPTLSSVGGGFLNVGANASALLTVTSGSFVVNPSVWLFYNGIAGFEAPPAVTISGVLVEPAVVPEPTTLALVGFGVLGATFARRKRYA